VCSSANSIVDNFARVYVHGKRYYCVDMSATGSVACVFTSAVNYHVTVHQVSYQPYHGKTSHGPAEVLQFYVAVSVEPCL